MSLEDDLELIRACQRVVVVSFGAVGIVVGAEDEVRRAFASNDRIHATHDLPGLDTFELRLTPIINLLAEDPRNAGPVVRDACKTYLVTAYEVLKPDTRVTEYSPLFKYFRHIRNASAHGGVIAFGDRRPAAVGPASWRGRSISREDEGKAMWPGFIGFPSALMLVEDAFKERHPAAPDLISRVGDAGQGLEG